jgi:hypothetical protein
MPDSFEDAMKKVAKTAYEDTAREFKGVIARLQRSHRGKPLEEVNRAVQQAFQKAGYKAPESDVNSYAAAISQGTPIEVKVDSLRL